MKPYSLGSPAPVVPHCAEASRDKAMDGRVFGAMVILLILLIGTVGLLGSMHLI